ncbi:hypothetical protein HDU80_000676 [Chytriomyces hyalinus]|nr:hypothetical protein HDU80_000676 [Chytriomyces hyalinus]
MDKLPAEIIRAILIHTDIDGDLIELARVCRTFALILDKDITFASAHIRHRFQLPEDQTEVFPQFRRPGDHRWKNLVKLFGHVKDQAQDEFPFAYKAALFLLVSQTAAYGLYRCTEETSLRIVESLEMNPTNFIHWENAINLFVVKNHVRPIEHVIRNRSHGANFKPLLKSLVSACDTGRADIVTLLLEFPSIHDSVPISLADALNIAAHRNHMSCIEALLNDPFHRITRQDRDIALQRSINNNSLLASTLLIQRGVSIDALRDGLEHAVAAGSTELVSLLLLEPGLNQSYDMA